MAEILERTHDRYLWWKKPDIPEVKICINDNRTGLGHVREWLEKQLPEDHKIVICFYDVMDPMTMATIKYVHIAFEHSEDYAAFKLVFSEYC